MVAAWLALAVTAAAAEPPAPPTTALERTAAAITESAAGLAAPADTAVALSVLSAESPELGRAVQTVLLAHLGRAGFKRAFSIEDATPESAEPRARAAGADFLLRLSARIDGADLTLTGDAVPTWVSFWAGADPVRAPGGAALAARAVTDAEVLTLAHLPLERLRIRATRFSLRRLAALPERVVALAVGDLDADGRPEIVALGTRGLSALRADGSPIAQRAHAEQLATRPPREPAGTVAIESGGERPLIALRLFGQATSELVELRDGALVSVARIAGAPVCSGASGVITGEPRPGRSTLAPVLSLDGGRSVGLDFDPVAVAASPRRGSPAFLAVAASGASAALDPELQAVEAALPELGAGAALGDLDGDGETDLVATLRVLSADRVRLLRFGSPDEAPLFESAAQAGAFGAAAAGDLDGDGRDEAVLALWEADGTSSLHLLGGEP